MARVPDAERSEERGRHAEPESARRRARPTVIRISPALLGDLLPTRSRPRRRPARRARRGRCRTVRWRRRNQLGLTPSTPPDDPNAPPRATFFDIGANIKDGAAVPAVGARAAREAHGRQSEGQSRRALPADGLHAAARPSAAAQDRADAATDRRSCTKATRGCGRSSLDGRPLPKVDEDLQPWWYGYSVGHWEGDTLVVEIGRLPRRRLARRVRQPADRRRAS